MTEGKATDEQNARYTANPRRCVDCGGDPSAARPRCADCHYARDTFEPGLTPGDGRGLLAELVRRRGRRRW